MRIPQVVPFFALIVLGGAVVLADEHEHDGPDSSDHHPVIAAPDDEEEHDAHEHEGAIDWSSGEGVNLGGFLFPELFLLGAFGDSTADPADLSMSDHDPLSETNLQSIHASAFLQLGDPLSGFANYDGRTDADGNYSGSLEEAFLHYEIIEGIQIGGGQFLNSFGFQNERHAHAWNFVDQYLINGRILNEGELTTIGGEVIIALPTSWKSSLTLGGGDIARHGHGDDHVHEHEEAAFDAENANFSDWVISGSYRADYGAHDHMAGTASFALGENGSGETSQIYGVGHEIIWNPATSITDTKGVVTSAPAYGGAFGAGSLRWRTEAMFRNVGAISEGDHREGEDAHGHHEEEEDEEDHGERRHADLDEFGIYSMLQYGLCDQADLAFRAEWISGIDEMDLAERWRLSPALTTYWNHDRTIHTRLQYNLDQGDDFGTEHSIWLQIGISWGGAPTGHDHEH